jgi:hypothetical protein
MVHHEAQRPLLPDAIYVIPRFHRDVRREVQRPLLVARELAPGQGFSRAEGGRERPCRYAGAQGHVRGGPKYQGEGDRPRHKFPYGRAQEGPVRLDQPLVDLVHERKHRADGGVLPEKGHLRRPVGLHARHPERLIGPKPKGEQGDERDEEQGRGRRYQAPAQTHASIMSDVPSASSRAKA